MSKKRNNNDIVKNNIEQSVKENFEPIEETEVLDIVETQVDKPKENKSDKRNDFIARKLKTINELSDEGKANSFAERVLKNNIKEK